MNQVGAVLSRTGRLIVLSNRLPVTVKVKDIGHEIVPSDGGLVSALLPVLGSRGGCWIGWTGTDQDTRLADSLRQYGSNSDYSFEPIFLTAAEKSRFYHGFSNEIVWPLFHNMASRCQFGPEYWSGYCSVNEKFAAAAGAVAGPGDFIWVHDYHLMMVADSLRARGVRNRLAYFHHIPFPSLDIFEVLPWREEILRALMQFDVIGFQTERDRDNFIGCLRHFLSNVRIWRIGERLTVRADGDSATVGAYPISIDFEAFASAGADPDVLQNAESMRERLHDVSLILGLDRLDYTKGIPERLTAFHRLLQCNPEMRGAVTLLQIVIPSREEIPEYQQLKLRIETLVSRINGEFGRPGWIPIQYFYRSVPRQTLMAFYRAADVALVTPLKDGMNLVAKEYCAARTDNRGVLVLSEFAGAAQELRTGALLVNPHDVDGVARVMRQALQMTQAEQRNRMEIMRGQIRSHDVFHWARSLTAESTPVAFMPRPANAAFLRAETTQVAFRK